MPSGERNGRVKLTDAQVLDLAKARAGSGLTLKQLAGIFGVSVFCAWYAVNVRASRLAPELFGSPKPPKSKQPQQDRQQVVKVKGWGGRPATKP